MEELTGKEVKSKLLKGLELDDYILISREVENDYGRRDLSILSQAFESLVAAIDLDLGNKISEKFVISCLENTVDFGEIIRSKFKKNDSNTNSLKLYSDK